MIVKCQDINIQCFQFKVVNTFKVSHEGPQESVKVFRVVYVDSH